MQNVVVFLPKVSLSPQRLSALTVPGGDFPEGPGAMTPRSQCMGSIPGQGTNAHMSQLEVPHATNKTWQ